MISVIVYGRNDAHGYNLHRRAALSLNCIAEVLTDPDDEIIFVDYNTPDELPTFVEALADTLTDRCLGLLRVLRVPAALHTERFARAHAPAGGRARGSQRRGAAREPVEPLAALDEHRHDLRAARRARASARSAATSPTGSTGCRASSSRSGSGSGFRGRDPAPRAGRDRAPRPGACASTSRR